MFTEIPEYIISKKMTRKDFNENIKVLKKVRVLYMKKKYHVKGTPEPDYDSIPISDDDLVDCTYFDKVISAIEHKQSEKKLTIEKFMAELKTRVQETQF